MLIARMQIRYWTFNLSVVSYNIKEPPYILWVAITQTPSVVVYCSLMQCGFIDETKIVANIQWIRNMCQKNERVEDHWDGPRAAFLASGGTGSNNPAWSHWSHRYNRSHSVGRISVEKLQKEGRSICFFICIKRKTTLFVS